MTWGHYQRECHRLLDDIFPNKSRGYKWLYDNYKVRHFSELDVKKDRVKLQEIYNELYKLSFKELDV